MRFQFDPLGGDPPGCHGACSGDGACGPSTCRQRYITSEANLAQVSRSVWKKDIAFSGAGGSSLDELFGGDTHAGSIYGTASVLWYYSGYLYIQNQYDNVFNNVADWSLNSPDYAQFSIDFNPCNNTVTYTYGGAEVFKEVFGFTPPYGDASLSGNPGGVDVRPATTDASFASTDHYGETIDIDNFEVTNTPCTEACCDNTTGDCTDVAPGQCPFKNGYPNTLCAQLGTSLCQGGTKPLAVCETDLDCPGSTEPVVEAGLCSPVYPPACAIARGSCCDTSPGAGGAGAGGVCTNNVLQANCGNPQQTWVKDGYCSDVAGLCHFGHAVCSATGGCMNFPNVGKKCATNQDCNIEGFCWAGICSPAALPGTCIYPALPGYCFNMGRCSGSADCDSADTGAGCCDPDCTPPRGCPQGETCLAEKQQCLRIPGGQDCAFCEGCTNVFPDKACHIPFDVADCPPPYPGFAAGIGCKPNPSVGCSSDADCPASSTGETCITPPVNRAGTLCLTDAPCSITASECLEHTGSCCLVLTGECRPDMTQADCLALAALDPDPQPNWTKLGDCATVGCSAEEGACCDHDTFGQCTDITFAACNLIPKGEWTKFASCANTDCTHIAIPTVSEWGLVVLTLLLLVGAKVYFGRRQSAAA